MDGTLRPFPLFKDNAGPVEGICAEQLHNAAAQGRQFGQSSLPLTPLAMTAVHKIPDTLIASEKYSLAANIFLAFNCVNIYS